MPHDVDFATFIRRIRAGDAQAAAELIRLYEPEVRLEVRMKLRDPKLRRVFDSMDICQSVFKSFFTRAGDGQYNLNRPEDLMGLLVVMARNKVFGTARKQNTQKRNLNGVVPLPPGYDEIDDQPSPSQQVVVEELNAEIRRRLSAEECAIADRVALGDTWEQIAAELGGTAQACRAQWFRARKRVFAELNLDEDD